MSLLGRFLVGILVASTFPVFAIAETPDIPVENRRGLRPLQLPDLSTLEKPVAEQLDQFQRELHAALAMTSTSDHDLADAYGFLGQLYHAYELHSAAEIAYLNAHQLDDADPQWTYLLGKLYSTTGRLEESLEYFGLTRQRQPEYTACMVNAGLVFIELNMLDSAENALKAALAVDPTTWAAREGLGRVAAARRNWDIAIEHFTSALDAVPEANRIHYQLAMAYRAIGDIEKAKAHLAQRGSVGIRVDDPYFDSLSKRLEGERVHLLRGRMAFAAGRYLDAASEFQRAVEAAPESCRAMIDLATALGATGQIDRAISLYEQASELCPDNLTARFNLGLLLPRIDRLDEALTHLKAVAEADPKDAEARLELAQLLAQRSDIAQATEFAREAVVLAPNREDSQLLLASLLIQDRHYTEAKKTLERAHRLMPDQGRIIAALARLLAACPDHSLRDGERAVELAGKVFQAQPIPAHGADLASALAEAGRCQEAAMVQTRLIEALEDPSPEQRARLERYLQGPPCALP